MVYWLAGLSLVLCYAAARGWEWAGGAQLHTDMEAVSRLLTAVVGTALRWFLSILLFFTFVPLLRAFDPETFFHRPEALPACSPTCFRLSGKRRMVSAW
jgi:hypothetical protein